MGKDNQRRRRSKAKARRAGRCGPRPGPDTRLRATRLGDQAAADRASAEQQVNSVLADALGALSVGDTWLARSAARALAELEGSRRAAVVRVLTARASHALTAAWQAGWQPVDVCRVSGRTLPTDDRALLVDAIAHEMATYAPATVDPRWAAQLRELDAVTWWPRDTSYLQAWHDVHGHVWEAVVLAQLRLLHLLTGLPRLQRLLPPPGSAVPSPRSAGRGPVDERILSRVRALLAKAESTTFPAEAEAFTAGAQALMARHSIDRALLSENRAEDQPQGRRIGVDNPYETPKTMLLEAVARANRCSTVWSRHLGFATVVGFPADLDAVEVLFTSLLLQATRAMTAAGARTSGDGRSRTRAFRSSFLMAYAGRIGERLAEATRGTVESAARESAASGGRDLVPLLAARSEEVERSVQALFPHLVHRPVRSAGDHEGWYSGRAAADLADLGNRPALEPRSRPHAG